MVNLLNRFLFAGLLIAASPIDGFASPVQSKLLPLIPREAQIVAGIEDPRNPDTRGHLLLVTVKNTFDFDDCQSLTGVDTHRGVDETIWIAASSPQGELNEHLLLVAGRFDREHIFQAAERNGVATGFYRGLEVLFVKPFAREQAQMHDIRRMAILDGQAVVFGTPWLVKKALDRYVGHEPADPHGADELTLGIRFGSTARVDFVVRTADDRRTTCGADGPARRHLFEAGSFQRLRPRFENLLIERNLVQGSIVFPGKELNACFTSVSCDGRLRDFKQTDETRERPGCSSE